MTHHLAFHSICVWCKVGTMEAQEVTIEDKVPQTACGTDRRGWKQEALTVDLTISK